MNIGTNYSLLAYQTANLTTSRQGDNTIVASGRSADTAAARPAASDKVTLSAAAQAFLSNASNPAIPRTDAQQQVLGMVNDDPNGADKIANGMAQASSQLVYNISDGNLRLRATGQLVTPDMMVGLSKLSDGFGQQLQALYDSEKVRGTDARQILVKMMDLQNSQADSLKASTKA